MFIIEYIINDIYSMAYLVLQKWMVDIIICILLLYCRRKMKGRCKVNEKVS